MKIRIGDVGGEQQLLCPVCGGTYTHLEKIEQYDSRPPEGRLSVNLIFSCEAGCSFAIGFQQHKGETFVSCDEIPDANDGAQS